MESRIITADAGKIYRRIYDRLIMGNQIHLGIDWSMGFGREDKEEYYEQIYEPIETTNEEN